MCYSLAQFNLEPFIHKSSSGMQIDETAAIAQFQDMLKNGSDGNKSVCFVWEGVDSFVYTQVKGRVYVVHDDEYRVVEVISS